MSEESVVDTVERADVAAAAEAGQLRDEPVIRMLATLSEVADQPPAFTLAALATLAGMATDRPRLAEGGFRCLAALTLATLGKSAIKAAVVRTRPFMMLDHGHYERGATGPNDGPWNSFPSGHTANAVAAARAISRVAPEAAGPLALGAMAVGTAQVPSASHHPLDVVAGAVLGWAAEGVVNALWPDRIGDEAPGGSSANTDTPASAPRAPTRR